MVNYSSRNLIKDYITFSFLLVCVNTSNSCSASSASFIVFLLLLHWEETNETFFYCGIQITLVLSVYFLRFLHSGHGNILCIFFISFSASYFLLFSFSDLPRLSFVRCVSAIYSLGKPEVQIFGLLLLHRHNCFPTLW